MMKKNVGVNDLDNFINGEICFEEIQGCLPEGIPIQNEIICSESSRAFYSEEEHDLYEKLCYANILRIHLMHIQENIDDLDILYAHYLSLKDKCSPHKLNWDYLLEKIQKESNMDELDIKKGESYYNTYQKTGSWPYNDYED